MVTYVICEMFSPIELSAHSLGSYRIEALELKYYQKIFKKQTATSGTSHQ